MHKKWKRLLSMLAILITVISIGTRVIADDGHDHDDDDDDDRTEYYQEENDNDDENRHEPQNQITNLQPSEYWNVWSREARNSPNNPLPITEPAELTVLVEDDETRVYFIPKEGQLLVSADRISELLGARVKFYQQSKIVVLQKGEQELAIRAGSNAAFENRIKTPMPTQATAYENSIYLPISVAANALGYRISFDNTKKALVLQSI
ncbi:copper amine oxidase N-terminal domain-containing protein [Neobacillus drentensis]|uniref:copper amine oxidase N-terminal domain-containing protein n=1 Tax=Neobacillus drentensis TaxID=220684 RepID=UPI002855F270|nr:copper amine oxidase N-terminal domain-containing protein [Neobacillus drentensis]MDR7240270.1 hypothetical protein [Neobacillus drentensis]